jgi:FtsH-binding integral membrane protein
MPQATKSSTSLRVPRVTLNSDGTRHPLQNSLAVFTLLAGVAAFPLGFVVTQHVIASCLGVAALGVGLYAQLISATREERIIIVTGLVAAFVGLALGLAHGGFYP